MEKRDKTLWNISLCALVIAVVVLGLHGTDVITLPDMLIRFIGIIGMAALFLVGYSFVKMRIHK